MISISPVHLIITAAGSSSRLGTGTKKEYLLVQDRENNTVLSLACIAFLNAFLDDKISSNFKLASLVITCPKNRISEGKEAVFSNKAISKIFERLEINPLFVEGGETRQLSVFYAMEAALANSKSKNLENTSSLVLIHDGARPWVDFNTIYNVLTGTKKNGACVPVIPVTDTIALCNDGIVESYINRSLSFGLQTPQGFLFNSLFEAHKKCAEQKRTDCTDDTTVWKAYCGNVYTCQGSSANTKITFASDLQKFQNH